MIKKLPKPKREKKKDNERTLDLLLEDLLPSIDRDATFADSVSSEVAETYHRLSRDNSLAPVLQKLRKRSLDDQAIEFLLRKIALIMPQWHVEKESLKQRQERRAAMASRLRKLAEKVATDPDLSGLRLSADTIAFNSPPGDQDELRSLADFMEIGAWVLEPSEPQLTLSEDGKELTPEEIEQFRNSGRSVSLKAFVLLNIFDLLEPHFSRAPNKETEALGAVLLRVEIKPGTVTQLRKKVRRVYYRDQ